ncbi:MAG: DUF3298 and DUF4163 domain-containing protein [Treponema sp.]|jgi:hypothetical protein|nr:DUF3298 and DUF4163 domain-containing protein [Treponema sp.]
MRTKNLKKYFVTVLGLAVILFSGCQSGPRAGKAASRGDAGPLGIIAYKVEREVRLYIDDPSHKMRISLRIPDVGRAEGDPLKRLVWQLFYAGQRPEEYAAATLAALRQRYEEMKEIIGMNPDYPGDSLNWYYTEDFKVPLVNESLITMKRNIEIFTGGAHGMQFIRWYVIDRKTAAPIGLDSLFPEESEPALETLLEDALLQKAGAAEEENLLDAGYFEDFIPVSDNFFLDSQGLGFHWDPYEIAPYAFGSIEVVIPYEKIRSLLTPRGLDLISSLQEPEKRP